VVYKHGYMYIDNNPILNKYAESSYIQRYFYCN
jgi:hypothetical protein